MEGSLVIFLIEKFKLICFSRPLCGNSGVGDLGRAVVDADRRRSYFFECDYCNAFSCLIETWKTSIFAKICSKRLRCNVAACHTVLRELAPSSCRKRRPA